MHSEELDERLGYIIDVCGYYNGLNEFFSASLKCWKLRNTLNFSLCLRSYEASWDLVVVGGIVRIGAVGAANGVPYTISYSASEMISPSILCLPPPNVIMRPRRWRTTR